MISLRRSVSELDRIEAVQKASLDGYRSAVEVCGRCAIEVDPDSTTRFRGELATLAKQIEGEPNAEALRETRISFLGTVEDYASKANRFVVALRKKVEASGRALEKLLDSIRQSKSDERRLQLGLGQLHSISQDPDITRVCPELSRAVAAVEESVENLRKQNQLAVASLQQEVASLQSALATAQEAASRDPVAGVLNRKGMLDLIRAELKSGAEFSLVFIWISNLEYLHRRYGSQCRDAVVAEFSERLREAVGDDPAGRWGEDRFVVLVHRPKPEAIWFSEGLTQSLAKPLHIKQPNWTREITLKLRTGVTEASAGATEARLLQEADKLLLALETIGATKS